MQFTAWISGPAKNPSACARKNVKVSVERTTAGTVRFEIEFKDGKTQWLTMRADAAATVADHVHLASFKIEVDE
jgi:hypothetical protein